MHRRDTESQYGHDERRSQEQSKRQLLRVVSYRFVSHWVLLLTAMRARWNAGSLEFRHDGEESG